MATAPNLGRRIGASGHPLTHEQERILESPPKETSKWVAFAGCAKTTSLVEYSHAWRQQALYLAFNSAIAGDAKGRFPSHVHTQTAHGYAYNALNVKASEDRLVKRLRPEHLNGCEDLIRPISRMTELAVRRAIIKSLGIYLISDDERIGEHHLAGFPYMVRAACVHMVAAVVERIMDFERSGMPFTHDVYLKAFAIRGRIADRFEYLMLDEAQDLNPVLIGIAQRSGRPSKVVGDPYQCLPPGEPVATPDGDLPIETVSEGDYVLSGSGRGSIVRARVAKVRTFHADQLTTIITKGGRIIRSTPNHCHFAGFSGDGGETGWCVYLMYREDFGYRVGVANDYKDPKQGTKLGWMLRAHQESADRAYVLGQRISYEEARLQEVVFSLKYGIPTAVFRNRNDSALGPEFTKKLFAAVDSVTGGEQLLRDHGIDIAYPHYRPKSTRSNRLNFAITLCADRGMHRHAVSGTDDSQRDLLAAAGLPTRASKRNGWRNEGSSRDLSRPYDLYRQIKEAAPHVNLIEKAALAEGKSLPVTPASNCVPGMRIFVRDRETGRIVFDEIASVITESYNGPVYDLDIERYHNYIVGDVVTHNSIYLFRGAQNAIDEFSGHRFMLSHSFRFGQAIAGAANFVLKQSTTPPDTPIVGNPTRDSKVREYLGVVNGRATILARTNLRLFESLIKVKLPFHVVGGIEDMISQVAAGYSLWKGLGRGAIIDGLVSRHGTWADLVDASETEDDPETVRLVKIVETYRDGIPEILEDLKKRNCKTEAEARIIVSTAHKAKGREWPTVIVLDDFVTPFELRQWLSRKRIKPHEYDQEINLLYVTVTRAIDTLLLSTDLYDEIAAGTGLPRI